MANSKKPDSKKCKPITLSLSPAERKALEGLARAKDAPMSRVVGELVLKAAGK